MTSEPLVTGNYTTRYNNVTVTSSMLQNSTGNVIPEPLVTGNYTTSYNNVDRDKQHATKPHRECVGP